MDNKFSIGMIVFNAELFLQACLDSIYDFAHEILIVEGSCPQARWDANPDGTSTDGTLAIISNYPDVDNKIKLVASQAWEHKNEMVNAYIPYVTGNYLFQVDSDEIWPDNDLNKIKQVLLDRPEIDCMEFLPLQFWHNFETIMIEGHWDNPFIRLFKFEPGAMWLSHEPPILLRPNQPQGGAYNDKRINATKEYDIKFFHYSYLTEKQARWKASFFSHYESGISSDTSTSIRMTCDWFEKVWKPWKDNPEKIESIYGTSPGGGPAWTPQGKTAKYDGQHPKAITSHPLWVRKNSSMNLDSARETLLLIKSIFDNHGLKFWLHGATLLGAVRYKDFIPHDRDIDICVFGTDLDKYIEAWPDLEKLGFYDTQGDTAQEAIEKSIRNLHIQRDIKNDVGTDIFPVGWYGNCWGYGGKEQYWQMRYPERCCKDFDTISFLGKDFLIPVYVDAYLSCLYGKNWRIPSLGPFTGYRKDERVG